MNEASQTRARANDGRQRRHLEVLARVSSVFSEAVLDYQRLLEAVARELAEATGSACSLRLLSEDRKALEPVAWFHSDPELSAALRTVAQQTASMDRSSSWRPVILERKTLRLFVAPEAPPPPYFNSTQIEFMHRHRFAHLLMAPLVSRGAALGGLALARRVGEPAFTDEEELLVGDLAARAALAIDNARLVVADRAMRDELRRLNDALEQRVRERTAELEAAVATTREQELRFQWVFENSLDGILVTDTETGGVTLANRAACEILGQSEDELRRRPRGGLVDRTDPRFPAAQEQWERTGRFRGELFLLRGDGSRLEAEYTATLFAAGGAKRTAMIIRDISARRAREHAEAQLAAIVKSSEDAIIGRTLDGVVTSWNRGAERIFGYAAEEILGQPIRLLFSDRHWDEEAQLTQRLRNGEHGDHFESVMVHKDGREVEVSVALSPIRDSSGEVIGVSKVARDITEGKRMQRELLRAKEATDAANRELEAALAATREQEELFRGIFERSYDAIMLTSPSGELLDANPATLEMFGLSKDELRARGWAKNVDPTDPRVGVMLRERERTGVYRGQLRFVRGDGSRFEGDISTVVFAAANGELRTSAVIRDLTSEKTAEAELIRAKEATDAANRELESFSYSVAHDLRAPLRSIDGFSQALLEDYSDKLDEDGRTYLRYVRESAQLMAQLIDDMLTLSRVTRSELRREEVDLSELARAILARFERTEPGRTVEVSIPEELLANGDPRLLAVVLDNLLGNAWKFTAKRDRARIELGATTKDGVTAYFVRDNGAGFDMAYASKLFGVFQRLHSSTEFEGTGVGLATVQRIVHRHGGRVWAEGQVDDGATFHFTLGEKARIE